MNNKKILIIDAMNTFIRNYVMNPSISNDGSPIGGTKGFLMSLQKTIRDVDPYKVFVVWDGGGGSAKRRAILKQYKEGRRPLKLNRAYDGLSSLEENQNRYDQMRKTIEYLNEMPIIQLMIDDVEADDVIAYICRMPSLKEDIKIIVSMDKDFYQLCDEKTLLFKPIQNEYINTKRIVEKFDIHPNNFAIARAIDGDKSDNIEGVKGVGLKTIAKKLSFLKKESPSTLDEVFKFCRDEKSTLKMYRDILKDRKKIETNYKIMQLYSPNISTKSSLFIKESIENFVPAFNRTEVVKMMSLDGIGEYNWNSLFQKFRTFVSDYKKDLD